MVVQEVLDSLTLEEKNQLLTLTLTLTYKINNNLLPKISPMIAIQNELRLHTNKFTSELWNKLDRLKLKS